MYKTNPAERERIKSAIVSFTNELKPIIPNKKELEIAATWAAGRCEHLVVADLIHVIKIPKNSNKEKQLFELEMLGHRIQKDLEYIIDHMIKERRIKKHGRTMYSVLYPKNTGTYTYSPCNIEIGFQGSKCTCGDMANCAYR